MRSRRGEDEAGWGDAEIGEGRPAVLGEKVEIGFVELRRGGFRWKGEPEFHEAAALIGGEPTIFAERRGGPRSPSLGFVGGEGGAEGNAESVCIQITDTREAEGAECGGRAEVEAFGFGFAESGGGEVEQGEARGVVAEKKEALGIFDF